MCTHLSVCIQIENSHREKRWSSPLSNVYTDTHTCMHMHTCTHKHAVTQTFSHALTCVCPCQSCVGWELRLSHYLGFLVASLTPLPPCLPQDSVKGQLLVALEHGACDSGSCLHALSVFLGNTHIQLRYSGSVNSAACAVQGLCSLGSLCSLLL